MRRRQHPRPPRRIPTRTFGRRTAIDLLPAGEPQVRISARPPFSRLLPHATSPLSPVMEERCGTCVAPDGAQRRGVP